MIMGTVWGTLVVPGLYMAFAEVFLSVRRPAVAVSKAYENNRNWPIVQDQYGWHKLRKDIRAELDHTRLAEFHGSLPPLCDIDASDVGPGAVRNLCNRVLVMESGRLGFDGDVEEGIHYLHYDEGDDDSGEDDGLGADV